jgi:hypothetical protein
VENNRAVQDKFSTKRSGPMILMRMAAMLVRKKFPDYRNLPVFD